MRLLARLSGALRGDPDMSERAASSAEAVAIARRLDDPATLVHALIARQMAIAGPDALTEMREIGAELEGLVDSTGDLEVIGDARGWSQVCWRTTLGLPATALQQIIDSTTEAIAPLRQPAKSWYLTVMQTVLALETGNFAGIDALLHESRRPGVRAWRGMPSSRSAWLGFALARERGELDEVLPLLTTAERDLPGYWMFQAAETFARAVTGHHDEARRGLARFAANGFGDLPRDNQWLWAMCHLGEAAIELDELPAVEQLLGHLRPYSSLTATAAFEVIAGPVARVVGELATRLRLFDEAEAAFREALAIVVRNGWRPWEAWTRLRHARMLRARGGPGDGAEALVQEDVARLIGTELGMPALLLECGAAAASEPAASSGPWPAGARPDAARDSIRLEGDVWAITFEGRTVRLRDARGLWYLARLLSSPGREVASVDLLLAAHQVPASAPATGGDDLRVGGDSADPVLDAAARAAYRARLMELQEDIEEATRFGDGERVEYMRTEFEAITRELTVATGIGGRAGDTSHLRSVRDRA